MPWTGSALLLPTVSQGRNVCRVLSGQDGDRRAEGLCSGVQRRAADLLRVALEELEALARGGLEEDTERVSNRRYILTANLAPR